MEKYRDHKPTMNFLRVMDQRTGIADRNIKWLNRSLAVHRLWGKLTAPFHPGRFRNR
jgi:hypothetical protein